MNDIVETMLAVLETQRRRKDSIRNRKYDDFNALVEKTTRKIKKVGTNSYMIKDVVAAASHSVLKKAVVKPAAAAMTTAAILLSPQRHQRRRSRAHRRCSLDTAMEKIEPYFESSEMQLSEGRNENMSPPEKVTNSKRIHLIQEDTHVNDMNKNILFGSKQIDSSPVGVCEPIRNAVQGILVSPTVKKSPNEDNMMSPTSWLQVSRKKFHRAPRRNSCAAVIESSTIAPIDKQHFVPIPSPEANEVDCFDDEKTGMMISWMDDSVRSNLTDWTKGSNNVINNRDGYLEDEESSQDVVVDQSMYFEEPTAKIPDAYFPPPPPLYF